MAATQIAIGLNKGFKTTPRELRKKPVNRKGAVSKRTTFVRSVVRTVVGYAPYEKRIMELLKNSADKRARKLAKRRLGTFVRAKKKVEEMTGVIAAARRANKTE